MFQYNKIPTINKTTRVTRNTATAIDHIITKTVCNKENSNNEIMKTDISDHFPSEKSKPEYTAQFIYKRIYVD